MLFDSQWRLTTHLPRQSNSRPGTPESQCRSRRWRGIRHLLSSWLFCQPTAPAIPAYTQCVSREMLKLRKNSNESYLSEILTWSWGSSSPHHPGPDQTRPLLGSYDLHLTVIFQAHNQSFLPVYTILPSGTETCSSPDHPSDAPYQTHRRLAGSPLIGSLETWNRMCIDIYKLILPVQYGVDRPEENRPGLVVKTDDDTCLREIWQVSFSCFAIFISKVRQAPEKYVIQNSFTTLYLV